MAQQFLPESPDKTQQVFERRKSNPASARSFRGVLHPLAQLQRTLGNRNVASLIQAKRITPEGKIIGLQRKLTVGAADDQYEQEADRVASQVVSMADSVAMASPQQTPQGEEERGETQPQPLKSKPLPAAASLTSFLQGQMDSEEKTGEAKDQEEDKDELLQAKPENNSAAFAHASMFPSDTKSLQRTCADCSGGSMEEAKTGRSVLLIQANKHGKGNDGKSLQKTVGHEAYPGLNERDATNGLFKPAASFHPLVQRYPVPRRLDCSDVVDWLNNNSPYSPEWAQTRCTYSFNGRLRISPPDTSGGGVTLTVKGHNRLTVSVRCPVDRPRWSPSRRANRDAEAAAWAAMRASLDAHEQQHRDIGQAWRGTLQDRFRAINFSVTGSDRADAMNQVRQTISSMQQQWVADAQAAQDAIDPFSGANLNCP